MLYLHGIGHFHPENVIDNDFLESLDIGVDGNWVLERVGIEERRTVLPLDYIRHTRNADPRAADECAQFSNADTAVFAARMAMERAGISPQQIGLVVAGGCSPQFSTPAESCRIAAVLGLSATAFDMNSACSSFITQCRFLSHMQPEALPDFVLLVNAENTTRTVDYNDRPTAVLWGDATSAAIVSTRVPSRTRIIYSTVPTRRVGTRSRFSRARISGRKGPPYRRLQFARASRPLRLCGGSAVATAACSSGTRQIGSCWNRFASAREFRRRSTCSMSIDSEMVGPPVRHPSCRRTGTTCRMEPSSWRWSVPA